MNFSTGTLGFTDLRDRNISSQTSAGLSINFNIQPVDQSNGQTSAGSVSTAHSAAQPTVATGVSGEELKPGTTNIVYNNSQQNSASNTLATLGHGNITVGGTVLEQNGELTDAGAAEDSPLAGLNRDTTDTSKEMWNSDYSQELDVTIDNRLLDPSRWNEFGQDYVNAAEASAEMFNAAVDKVQQFRQELAAMGQDLPEHLGQLLGERGEQLVDELIRAGLSDETIVRILADDRLAASLLGLNAAIERCTSQEACTTAPERKPQANSLNQYESGDNLIEIFDQRSPLQIGVQYLGYLYGELQQLAIIDPQAARAVELAIRTFTGGPFKVALSEASSALTTYVLSSTYGDAIDQQFYELMLFASSKVQGTDVGQFANGLEWEKNNLTQGEIADFGGNNLTLDGIRLSGFIIGAMGSVVGSGGGNSNRVAGNGGEADGAKGTATRDSVVANDTTNINAQSALRAKLSGLQKAQETAAATRLLPDGRVRYYTQEVPARTEGATRGASFVTEFDPKTGNTRQWMESYDHSGSVIRVHPKAINGQSVDAQHYPPTGTELESWGKK